MPGQRGCRLVLCSVLEAPAFVAGLDDLTVVGEAVEQRGCHLGVAEDGWPFAERQVCRDDAGCALVELADQVEQELAAGLGEREVSQFIQDEEVGTGDQIGDPSLAFGPCFCIQLVH